MNNLPSVEGAHIFCAPIGHKVLRPARGHNLHRNTVYPWHEFEVGESRFAEPNGRSCIDVQGTLRKSSTIWVEANEPEWRFSVVTTTKKLDGDGLLCDSNGFAARKVIVTREA